MFFKAHKNQTVCYRNNIRSFQKKKNTVQTDFEEGKSCKVIPGEKIFCTEKIISHGV